MDSCIYISAFLTTGGTILDSYTTSCMLHSVRLRRMRPNKKREPQTSEKDAERAYYVAVSGLKSQAIEIGTGIKDIVI